MRLTIVYTVILFLMSSNLLLGQEKRIWNNTEEIYERLNYHRENLNEDSAIYYVDELIRFTDKPDGLGNVGGINTKVHTLLLFNRQEEAFELALTTYNEHCEETKSVKNCTGCGHISIELAKLMNILKAYRQGIRYLDMICEEKKESNFYFQKAKLYLELGLSDSALIMTEKWIVLQKKEGSEVNLIGAYNQHGIIARGLKRFDVAIVAFSNAIEIARKRGLNLPNYAFIMGNLGSCYYQVENYEKAYEYLLLDSEGSDMNKYKQSFIKAEITLAEIDFIRKDYSVLIKRLNNLLDNYGKHMLPLERLTVVEKLMNVYKALGKESAYKIYMNLWIDLNKEYYQSQGETYKSMISQQAETSLKQVTEKMKLEKQLKDQELVALKNEAEKKRFKLFLLIMALVMGMGVVLFFFWRYRVNQTKMTIIKQARLDAARYEQELLRLKVKKESKNVQLLSHELQVKQDFSSNLMRQLDQVGSLTTAELKNMELFIQNELDVKSSRAQIQEEMGGLSGEFYNSLTVQFPNLTDMDLKLAAMIVMNMSNKEIAISKNIATTSVKKTKTPGRTNNLTVRTSDGWFIYV